MERNRRETLALAAGVVVVGVGAFGVAMQTALDSQPDFTLSSVTVMTAWNVATVGTLTPFNAPAGAYFMLVEGNAASGDETGLAVVNG